MPNPFFKFKEFTVFHDRCAMKVGTDGVLLGAWTDISGCNKILDVGTGTGLIAMMCAQRNRKVGINAIDIDDEAIEQAKDNIKNSPFSERISCIKASFQELEKQTFAKYDLIVSNPPFFTQSLKSPDRERTLARHNDSLSTDELVSISSGLLTDKGKLSVIYPFEYKDTLIRLAKEYRLFVVRITNVYPTLSPIPKRVLMELSKEELHVVENNLIIEKERHVYSDEFIGLVKDFYWGM